MSAQSMTRRDAREGSRMRSRDRAKSEWHTDELRVTISSKMLRRTLPFFALAALFAACANAPIDDETESDATAKSSSSSTSSSGGTKDAATAKDTGASSSSSGSSSGSSGSSGSDASVVDVVVVPDSAASNTCPSGKNAQNAILVGLGGISPSSCGACIPLLQCCFALGGKDYCVPDL